MTTQEIANRLVELCKEGQFQQVVEELYSPDILSIEPKGAIWPEGRGLEFIQQKGEQWMAMVAEVHDSYISDPLVADQFFTIQMRTDVTLNESGARMVMDELCLYRTENGKIVEEQFFYTPAQHAVES